MTFERFPHTATLTYLNAGTFTTLGVFVPSTAISVSIPCRIEMNTGGRYVVGASGNRIDYSMNVFCSPSLVVPDNAVITYGGKTNKVLDVPPFQKHKVIRC